jgi:hypothetical protein
MGNVDKQRDGSRLPCQLWECTDNTGNTHLWDCTDSRGIAPDIAGDRGHRNSPARRLS